ncbi:uncharacterized protein RSE6_05859 [Rhynchosporium secalis]|uniref:UBC core domain-containing protein n=1 Tax=Rhynchosporium secalis TaxID=38038 RepID=A0A1E1M8W2_RHYSE|nr:uncharacterized protein RSE6_05859 [Rhynchosporium secalis]
MDSKVYHPNIFGGYICASIFNTTEGYTPAYTLKSIAIQLLSFFSSDEIEQVGGVGSVDLNMYRSTNSYIVDRQGHVCRMCPSGASALQPLTAGSTSAPLSPHTPPRPVTDEDFDMEWPSPQKSSSIGSGRKRRQATVTAPRAPVSVSQAEIEVIVPFIGIQKMKMPDEILLLVSHMLEDEELMLECFCFKTNYIASKLGVGVSIEKRGRIGSFESEFDLLSLQGFKDHRIRRSVQGVGFQHWLGLPISNGHWRKVRENVITTLSTLSTEAGLTSGGISQVIYAFMNDIVVKLNKETEKATIRAPYYPYEETPQSGLLHASEKAIESYFHLFHLLLCLATEQPSIAISANNKLEGFARGENSKDAYPNLGHLLVAALITDVPMTEKMMKSIVRETIIRNVVWMLDSKGSGMAELAYLEPSPVSEYRLKHTFEAGKTSYRLLMFLNLFRKVAVGSPRKSLSVLRDEAFERHGAPPRGSAKGLAESIKRIHQVTSFTQFLHHMDIGKPSAEWFTNFLKDCIQDSVNKGYHRTPLNQGQALMLRQREEPNVVVASSVYPQQVNAPCPSFFPGHGNSGTGRGGYGEIK